MEPTDKLEEQRAALGRYVENDNRLWTLFTPDDKPNPDAMFVRLQG
jgi:hypothetical protein